MALLFFKSTKVQGNRGLNQDTSQNCHRYTIFGKMPIQQKKPTYFKDVLQKLERYCAYQERCHQDVKEKLKSFSISHEEKEEIVCRLIENGFLNEERFARTFARGKFRIKKWGKYKITQELHRRSISDYCIQKGLSEIDEKDYLKTLKSIIANKKAVIKTGNVYVLRDKISKFAIGKGFEPDLVWEEIKRVMPD